RSRRSSPLFAPTKASSTTRTRPLRKRMSPPRAFSRASWPVPERMEGWETWSTPRDSWPTRPRLWRTRSRRSPATKADPRPRPPGRTGRTPEGPKESGVKIGITCYPTYGGSGVVATELGHELARRGHDVHFISYALPTRLNVFADRVSYHEVSVPSYPLFQYAPYDLALATRMGDVALHEG